MLRAELPHGADSCEIRAGAWALIPAPSETHMKLWLALSAIMLAYLPLAACATREIPIADLRLQYGLPASRTFEPSPGVRVREPL